ncbi:MAG: efflux RND transporter periplasmic adaptor subunit [Flavobacteriales bacterium]|nr:efflux RND transporter periplasmic adaptor subunit [Flavobacteriales bacterium]
MKYRNLLFIALSVVILSACSKKREHIRPEIGDITESVYASARVKADGQYTVQSVVSGVILKATKKTGQIVHQGDTLFIIRGDQAVLSSENALELLQLSRENSKKESDKLTELRLQTEQAREKYDLDSALYYRQKNLWNQQIGSKVELEQRELAFQLSKKNYLAARNRFNQAKSQLENETRRAEIGYEISKVNKEDFIVKSRLDGVVYDMISKENELITPQNPLAVIGAADVFVLEMQVDEYDISKVKIGQLVYVSMDSHPGKVFEAQVSAIDPIMNERTRTFLVEAVFSKQPELIFPNLTAECNVVITEKKQSLTIPRKYLFEDKFVYNEAGEKIEVGVGLMDYEKVEITSGIDQSTELYLEPKP